MPDQQTHISRNVIALSALTFCYAAFQGISQSIVPLSMAHLRFTKTTVGVIQAVPGIIAVFLGAPLARMANGRWRRETLTSCFVLSVVASLLYGVASQPVHYVLPHLLFGLSSSAFWSNMVATSLRLGQSQQHSHKIQAYVTGMQGFGAFGGPLIGGYLSIQSFTRGFYAGVAVAAIGVVASRFLSPSEAIEPQVGLREFVVGAYRTLFRLVTRQKIVIIGMCYVALNCFLIYVMGGSFYLLYASQIGLSAFLAAALISGREAIGALLRLRFGTVSRYLSPIALLGICTICASISLSLLSLTGGLLGAGVIAVAQGVFLAFLPPAVNTLIGMSTKREEQSFAIVGMHSSNFIAQSTMSPMLGLLLANFGYGLVYPIIGGVWAVLGLLVLLWGMRTLKQS